MYNRYRVYILLFLCSQYRWCRSDMLAMSASPKTLGQLYVSLVVVHRTCALYVYVMYTTHNIENIESHSPTTSIIVVNMKSTIVKHVPVLYICINIVYMPMYTYEYKLEAAWYVMHAYIGLSEYLLPLPPIIQYNSP